MNFLDKFKEWLNTTVKVDYNKIAVDVRGLAEHVDHEFQEVRDDARTLIDKAADDLTLHYDGIITDLKKRYDGALGKVNARIDEMTQIKGEDKPGKPFKPGKSGKLGNMAKSGDTESESEGSGEDAA